MRQILILILIFIATSCGLYHKWLKNNREDILRFYGAVPVLKVEKGNITNDSVKYTDVRMEPFLDSLEWMMFLECDSNYNVLLNRIEGEDSIQTELKNNQLQVKGYLLDSIQILHETIEIMKMRTDTVFLEKKVEVPIEKPYTPWWVWMTWGVSIVIVFWIGMKF
jgi:hypothetical protein